MRTVPLYGKKAAGRVALVDDEDYELVMHYRWYVHEVVYAPGRLPDGPYALTSVPLPGGGTASRRMHTLITGWSYVDHADCDGLNNQRYNLREADDVLNKANQRKGLSRRGRPMSSAYKGVSWRERDRKWRASIAVNGKSRYLGVHANEIEAAKAYDAAAREAFGEFARPNFP